MTEHSKARKSVRGKAATVKRRRTLPKAAPGSRSATTTPDMEIARLTRERDEALEQQAATAEVLKALSRSTFDLQSLLNTLLEKAVRLCGAEMGLIYRQDGDVYRAAASFGHSARFLTKMKESPIHQDRGSATGRAILERRVVHIPDALSDVDYRWGVNIRSEKEMHRTILAAPMLKGDAIIGVIAIRRTQFQPFTEKQIAVLSNFADQAIIAIENARLVSELHESLQQQIATADVLKVISRSTFDLQRVLNNLVESAARLCEADMASINREREDGAYQQIANYGHSPELVAYMRSHPIPVGRASVAGRVVMEGKIIHIHDVLSDPDYEMTEAAKVGGIRTMLGVPLLREGIPIGVIALQRRQIRPFTESQIKLVETFADQAVIAIENARLFEAEQQRTRELTESLAQQTATSEVLRVISSSPGELEPVFSTMLENAVRLCDSKFGNIYRWDGEALHLLAAHNSPPAIVEHRRRTPYGPHPNAPMGRMVATKRLVHVIDASAEGAYVEQREPGITAAVELGGVRTALYVPMLKESELIGVFTIFRQEVRPFTAKQIEIVQNFAAQAVIATENARLLNELRQRTADLTESLEQQTATSEVLKVISSSPGDLQPVFATMLENAVRICDAKLGALYRREADRVRLVAMCGVEPALKENLQGRLLRPAPNTVLGRIARIKATVHIADVLAEQDFFETPTGFDGPHLALQAGARTLLGVPMLRENELVGDILIYRQDVRPFTDKQIGLLTNFAAQAVIAIENARLLNELRQRTDDLSEALEQQTATSEVLRVISSSPGELQPVFDAMLENAVRICDATYGNIYSRDRETFRLVASHKTPPAFTEYRRRNPMTGSGAHWADPMMKSKAQVHISDLALERGFIERDPSFVAAVELGGARSALAVPMLKEEEIIGAFALARQEVRPFAKKQIALVTSLAAQAVIAIENARLLAELRQRTDDLTESLEQQTATSEILEVISNSPTDSQPAFDAIVRSGLRLFPNGVVVISLPDGDHVKLAAIAGADADDREKLRARYPLGLSREYITSTAIMDAPDFADAREAPVELVRGARNFLASGYRGITVVPMLRGDLAIGAISIVRRQPGALTEKQRELLRIFASQAVIAIENTRLFRELRARTDELGRSVGELRALGDVSQAVNSTLELETVLDTIVAKAVQLSSTEAGAIYVFDDRQREFRLRATYGMDQELIAALTRHHIGLDEPNVTAALAQNEPTQVADLQEETPSDLNEITLRAGYRARLVAPLIRGEHVVGLLVVRRRTPGAFLQNTVDLIKTFAAQSTVAIENARLFKSVEASLEDLRTAQDRLVQTQKLASLGQLTAGIAHEIKNPLNFVNNFSGVSTELIDELQETLAGVKADSKTRVEITELTDTLRDNLNKIVQHGRRADSIVKNMLLHSREGSGEHRPVDINALVEEAVNLAYHGARAEKQGFNVTLERSLDPDAGQVDCFPQEITRVLLNLISNGFYAATARKGLLASNDFEPKLTAMTTSLGERVEIRIRDNGTGISAEVKEKIFNPFFTTKPAGEGTGLGLSISHDIIVKQHSGSIEVNSQPGEYTEVRIVLPRAAAFPH